MAERNLDLTRQRRPFTMLERFADEIDDLFDFPLGIGRAGTRRGTMRMWTPQIEVQHQNNELVVRADLPGMKREDISVDASEREITISGERRQEQESERGGFYHTERSYGSFTRTIPLPEGAIADQANATFRDGVLEIRMPAPPEQVNRGRKLEIKEGAPGNVEGRK